MLILGVDSGGTFTDFFAFDEGTRETKLCKVESRPANPIGAFLKGIRTLDIDLGDVRRIVHGTTIATNALVQRKGAKIGLVTTEGFRDVIEFGQLRRYDVTGRGLWDTRWSRPPPYVPRPLRFEVAERVLHDGSVLTHLEEGRIADIAQALGRHAVDAVAVCFVNSYVNGEHERRAGEILGTCLPGVPISLSTNIVPDPREFERWSTTVVNAYVAPLLRNYLKELGNALRREKFSGDLFYMTSAGGILTETTAPKQPIRFLLSGPAAGVSAAVFHAEASRVKGIISYDMGGTSTDVSLIKDLVPAIAHERLFDGAIVRVPHVDVVTIGAGAGSIAYVGSDGGLRVGPKSAGAFPGPACYKRGGDSATVTDANLILGRLGANTMLAGNMALDEASAITAISSLAAPLGVTDIHRVAAGIIDVCVSNMCGLIRTVSIERGHDPRDLVLVAFGGAGGMHAVPIASELGIKKVLIPPDPGNACAVGLLTSDLRQDYGRSYITEVARANRTRVQALWREMASEGTKALTDEGLPLDKVKISYFADMRYLGQSWQLTVPLHATVELAEMGCAFHDLYHQTYGYAREEMPVELVELRVVATGEVEKPFASPPNSGPAEGLKQRSRKVYFAGAFEDCPTYERQTLGPGSVLSGPAIVEEYGSSVLLPPLWQLTVNESRSLLIESEQRD